MLPQHGSLVSLEGGIFWLANAQNHRGGRGGLKTSNRIAARSGAFFCSSGIGSADGEKTTMIDGKTTAEANALAEGAYGPIASQLFAISLRPRQPLSQGHAGSNSSYSPGECPEIAANWYAVSISVLDQLTLLLAREATERFGLDVEQLPLSATTKDILAGRVSVGETLPSLATAASRGSSRPA